MGWRKSVSNSQETHLLAILEKKLLDPITIERSPMLDQSMVGRSPLLDRRYLRSWSSTPASRSSQCKLPLRVDTSMTTTYRLETHSRRDEAKPLLTVPKSGQPKFQRTGRGAHLHRSQSSTRNRSSLQNPYFSPQNSPYSYQASPQRRHQYGSNPQYRVNPPLKFDERLLPERENYGIAGFNTSRRHRSSTSSPSDRDSKVGSRSTQPKRGLRIWRAWRKRFLQTMMTRIRIRVTCSRLLHRIQKRIRIQRRT